MDSFLTSKQRCVRIQLLVMIVLNYLIFTLFCASNTNSELWNLEPDLLVYGTLYIGKNFLFLDCMIVILHDWHMIGFTIFRGSVFNNNVFLEITFFEFTKKLYNWEILFLLYYYFFLLLYMHVYKRIIFWISAIPPDTLDQVKSKVKIWTK